LKANEHRYSDGHCVSFLTAAPQRAQEDGKMLHHHINALDIERLDGLSSAELEAHLADIESRIAHLWAQLQESQALAEEISKRVGDRRLAAEQPETKND
jgi:hypothetical protein